MRQVAEMTIRKRGGSAQTRIALAAVLFLCWGAGAWGQNAPPTAASDAPVTRRNLEDGAGLPSGLNPALQERMAERRNSDRQKALMADTDKLLQLAEELRDEVAKSNKDELSIGVVKKSEQIEKLAKSVKEKMRGY